MGTHPFSAILQRGRKRGASPFSITLALVIALLFGCSGSDVKIPLPTILQPHDEFIIGYDNIGGEVKGARGPEAGVWVIAETVDLPTRFAKIVVTDDKGRFLIPDLPKSSYKVWVRGYGLVDSPKVDGVLGKRMSLAAGKSSPDQPKRPMGIERNLVLTLWDWSRSDARPHVIVGTDKRKPSVNIHGPVYGTPESSTHAVPVFEPARHRAREIRHPVRDPKGAPSQKIDPKAPSPYAGAKPIQDDQTSDHDAVMDERERVWFAARIRGPQNPRFCGKDSTHPSARVFPLARSIRQLSMYDPKSGRFTLVDTCYSTHRLVFAEDAHQTLWSGSEDVGTAVLGWFDRKRYEDTGDEATAQGWTPFVLDTNGNGRRDAWTEPDQPLDPNKDQRLAIGISSIAVHPTDGSIWGTVICSPGYIARVAPGADPTTTSLTEIYRPPSPGYGPRGGDIDGNGVFWASLASGHLASFDRRKCKGPLNGPAAASGQHCPEGWTLHVLPGPQSRGRSQPGSAEPSCFTWVDRFDISGLGRNVPIATGNLNDSLLALVDGKFVNLIVPYPSGYVTQCVEGRVDDPNSGWHGRGLWTNTTRTMFHLEAGAENRPKVVRFQLRPNPLAR